MRGNFFVLLKYYDLHASCLRLRIILMTEKRVHSHKKCVCTDKIIKSPKPCAFQIPEINGHTFTIGHALRLDIE